MRLVLAMPLLLSFSARRVHTPPWQQQDSKGRRDAGRKGVAFVSFFRDTSATRLRHELTGASRRTRKSQIYKGFAGPVPAGSTSRCTEPASDTASSAPATLRTTSSASRTEKCSPAPDTPLSRGRASYPRRQPPSCMTHPALCGASGRQSAICRSRKAWLVRRCLRGCSAASRRGGRLRTHARTLAPCARPRTTTCDNYTKFRTLRGIYAT